MKFIGITGGVGAGKSELLHYIEEQYPAKILLADEVAHVLMKKGTDCYRQIRETFAGEDLYTTDGEFDRKKLAEVIFQDESCREKINGIVHPAVKQEILNQVEQERNKGQISYFILEAALLIEDGYDKICDELWYIHTTEEVRRKRLKESRGYPDAKIDAILKSQLPEEVYRRYCSVIIENSGTLEDTFCQIRQAFAADGSSQTR